MATKQEALTVYVRTDNGNKWLEVSSKQAEIARDKEQLAQVIASLKDALRCAENAQAVERS